MAFSHAHCIAGDIPAKPVESDSTQTLNRMLFMEFVLIDLPFLHKAAQMRANSASGNTSTNSPSLKHYFEGYESPSMQQALTFTKSLHSLNYYANNKLWDKWVRPDSRKKKIINRVGANITAGLVDLAFTYYGIVFSPQWLHEEFHRAGMTMNSIHSYDETYNRFNGGLATGSVSKVTDENLIRWKKDAPEEMIRSFAAGTESEILLLKSLQKDNFRGASYPNVLMNILLTKHAVDYVNQFKKSDFDASIDSMNFHGGKIQDRDFVGWDFSAWVYDLHRPDEAYNDRGVHPSGTGIDRAIKNAKLSDEERKYLTQMGKMQYLNFLSPFIIGVNHIRLNNNTFFNFAVRHYLTSFGYDLNLDIFINRYNQPFIIGLHGFRNNNKLYPGIEFEVFTAAFSRKNNGFKLQPKVILWLQPDNQRFYDTGSKPGGLAQLRFSKVTNRAVNVYLDIEGKTHGWAAGNPYIKSNLTVRTGITCKFIK